MQMVKIIDVLTSANQEALIDDVVYKLGYMGTPVKPIVVLYTENLLHELSTYTVKNVEGIVGIYHFGFKRTMPHPVIQFFSKDDILENTLKIPAYEKLISKLLLGEASLSEKEVNDVIKFAPILPVDCLLDFDKALGRLLGTAVYVQDKGSLFSLASEVLVRIILARGFLPLHENWDEVFEEDESFWLDEDEDEKDISIREQALCILSCYRMLRDLYHLLE